MTMNKNRKAETRRVAADRGIKYTEAARLLMAQSDASGTSHPPVADDRAGVSLGLELGSWPPVSIVPAAGPGSFDDFDGLGGLDGLDDVDDFDDFDDSFDAAGERRVFAGFGGLGYLDEEQLEDLCDGTCRLLCANGLCGGFCDAEDEGHCEALCAEVGEGLVVHARGL